MPREITKEKAIENKRRDIRDHATTISIGLASLHEQLKIHGIGVGLEETLIAETCHAATVAVQTLGAITAKLRN